MASIENGPIVGIDLGTTNSVVAGVLDGKITILSEDGNAVMPSVIGLDANGSIITGVVAQNQQAAFPDRTIASVKRKMGLGETIELGDQTFTPQEVSAVILRRLANRASMALGQPVDRVVITVPAFFDENQRQATREAGLLAGLTVERIINEPTAATLVYHAGTMDRKHIVVYDFGGGTFDVSVVRFEMDVVEVLSSKGDTLLGGDDLDQLLLDYVAEEFKQQQNVDLREELTTRYRLLQACEAAKRKLSQSVSADISEEFIAQKEGIPLNLNHTIERHEFEKMIKPLIDQTLDSVDAALRDADLTLNDIDDLVLVGGSTRIPLVEQRLSEEFNLSPSRAVDPDLAVALGAATLASQLEGLSVGPVLVDITGHTLGIEVLEGISAFSSDVVFSPIIKRNSPLPATFEESYSRLHEGQKQVDIHVLQGESRDVSRNQSIGRFLLDMATGDKASDDIIVRFDLTLDGILKVTATQQAGGKSKELVIDNALSDFVGGGRDYALARLDKLFTSSDKLLSQSDLPALATATATVAVDSSAGNDTNMPNLLKYPAAAALLAQCQTLNNIPPDDLAEIESTSKALRKAIANNNSSGVASLSQELDDILFYIEG